MNKYFYLSILLISIGIALSMATVARADYTVEVTPALQHSYDVNGSTLIADYDADGVPVGFSNGNIQTAFYGATRIAYPGAKNNRAEGVNNFGVVAGYSQVPVNPKLARSPLRTVGWLWSKDRGFFKTFPGLLVMDVNDQETVLSYAPGKLTYVDGVVELLPTVPNTWGAWLYHLDNYNTVLGNVRTSSTAYTYSGVVFTKQ